MTETFAETARTYADLVGRIRADQWDAPGLGEWSLRSLVGHTSRSLVTVETYLAEPATEETVPDAVAYYAAILSDRTLASSAGAVERGVQAGLALGDDPSATLRALLATALARVDREDDPLVTTLLGGMRLSEYLRTRVLELVVHGLDIAAAAGLPAPDHSAAALTEAITLAAGVAVRTGHGPELVLALTGRRPLDPGFSAV